MHEHADVHMFLNCQLQVTLCTPAATGLDPQTKAWVGHSVCVVETSLATQHWSGKSEGCA